MSAIHVPWLCGPVLALSELVCYEWGNFCVSHGFDCTFDDFAWQNVASSCTLGRLVAHLKHGSADCLGAHLDTMCHFWTRPIFRSLERKTL